MLSANMKANKNPKREGTGNITITDEGSGSVFSAFSNRCGSNLESRNAYLLAGEVIEPVGFVMIHEGDPVDARWRQCSCNKIFRPVGVDRASPSAPFSLYHYIFY